MSHAILPEKIRKVTSIKRIVSHPIIGTCDEDVVLESEQTPRSRNGNPLMANREAEWRAKKLARRAAEVLRVHSIVWSGALL